MAFLPGKRLANFTAAITLGSILPGANCPSSIYCIASLTVMCLKACCSGLPKLTQTFSTSVSMSSTSVSMSSARVSAARSLSMTAATPVRDPSIFSITGMPPPPAVTTMVESQRRFTESISAILLGVGEATTTMRFLKERKMDELITSLTQPVLGICLGMQLMCKSSEEGNVDCLGIFDVPVKLFVPTQQTQKIPHMGWNQLYDVKSNLFSEQLNEQFVYFVHSFYVPMCEHTIATTDYIQPFSAALNKNNFYATQFHPEKSGDVGEQILKNFLAL